MTWGKAKQSVKLYKKGSLGCFSPGFFHFIACTEISPAHLLPVSEASWVVDKAFQIVDKKAKEHSCMSTQAAGFTLRARKRITLS